MVSLLLLPLFPPSGPLKFAHSDTDAMASLLPYRQSTTSLTTFSTARTTQVPAGVLGVQQPEERIRHQGQGAPGRHLLSTRLEVSKYTTFLHTRVPVLTSSRALTSFSSQRRSALCLSVSEEAEVLYLCILEIRSKGIMR